MGVPFQDMAEAIDLLFYTGVPTDSWAPEAESGLSVGLAPHHSTLCDISMQHHIVDVRHTACHSAEPPHPTLYEVDCSTGGAFKTPLGQVTPRPNKLAPLAWGLRDSGLKASVHCHC